jgi:hypothetical protein
MYNDIPKFDHERLLPKITVDQNTERWVVNLKRRISAGKKLIQL